MKNVWPTVRRRSQNIRIALLDDLLNVADHAAVGSAPSMTTLIMFIIWATSGSLMPAHATNGGLTSEKDSMSQCDFIFEGFNLCFFAKRTII